MLNFTRIPAPRVTIVDPQTGIVSNEWFRFFNNLYTIAYAATGSVTAGTYGSASAVPQITIDSFGNIIGIADVTIAIDASQIVSGIIASARISGAYTGITGVGTLTVGTWNASAITTPYGGTGLTSYTAGDTLYYASGSALSKLAIGASTYINTSSGTAPQWTDPATITIGKATNIAGGAANRIAYQTAADTTDFIVAPTISNTYLEWSGTAFQWTANPLGTVTSVAALTLGTTGTDLSSTVANGTTTPVITLNVPTASSVNRGALSAADWTTFNSKAPGVTFTTNYIPYGQGTTTLNQSAGLQFDGTNFTTTGTASATKLIPTGGAVTGNGIYLPAANSIGLTTNGVVRTYWDASNHTLVGGVTTSRASLDYALQVETTNSLAGISAYRNQNVAGAAPAMWLGRSRGTTNGSFTAVQSGDTLGALVYSGADGTTDVIGAAVSAIVGNTVSSNIVPTYLTFRTMNDAGTYAERMRLFASGGVSIGNTTDPGATNLSVTGSATATGFIPTSAAIPTNGMYLPAANTIGFAINSANAVTLNSTGLGIGIGPSFKLHVSGASGIVANFAATGQAGVQLTSGTATSPYINWYSSGTTLEASIYALAGSGAFIIGTGASGAEKMRVYSGGGVSIGNTTSPGAGGLRVSGLMYPQQATTAGAPAYVKGALYFDTTLNKLRVGGATAWETITSV